MPSTGSSGSREDGTSPCNLSSSSSGSTTSTTAAVAVPPATPARSAFAFSGAVVDTMLASALSGMIARVPMHPIDTCKAKLQVQQQFLHRPGGTLATPAAPAAPAAPSAVRESLSASSFLHFFRHTLRTEGVRGLYSGFGVTFFGAAPAACLYFTSYELSKDLLSRQPVFATAAPFFTHFASGLIAESASCVLWVPIDVVKERLQVQQQLREMMQAEATRASSRAAVTQATHSPPLPSAPPATLYRGNLHAIATIARIEGFRGVYRGYGATVASFGPFSAIYLSGYEQCKDMWARLLLPPRPATPTPTAASSTNSSSSTDLPFLVYALSGATAGGIASILTNPLDLVKLRMQVQRGNTGFTFGYRNIAHGLVTLVREEGPRALLKGAAARCLFHIPSTAITIAVFDSLKNYLRDIRLRATGERQ